jgi:hypothetical protein
MQCMNCFSKIHSPFLFWFPKINWGLAPVAPKDAPTLLKLNNAVGYKNIKNHLEELKKIMIKDSEDQT